jgi:hypothetical protein
MTNISKDFYAAVEGRRTYYGLSKESDVSDQRIEEVINHALKHTPSEFNTQAQRIVVLLGENHTELWNITTETLRKIVPVENFAATEERMKGFSDGYGTVLFFEDMEVIESYQKQLPTFADNFPVWAQQSNGMLQYIVWTALEVEGFGASLQHYNPLIDDEVKGKWDIPSKWNLIAQMPFGKPSAAPSEKQYQPLENRIKVFK